MRLFRNYVEKFG